MMLDLRFCGPKLSLFGLLLSIWGIVQLSLMALAFYSRSVALVDDLSFNETEAHMSPQNYENAMDEAYDKNVTNCVVAAAMYVLTLLISIHQYWLNTRVTPHHRYQRHY
jgi:ribonuclease kappa